MVMLTLCGHKQLVLEISTLTQGLLRQKRYFVGEIYTSGKHSQHTIHHVWPEITVVQHFMDSLYILSKRARCVLIIPDSDLISNQSCYSHLPHALAPSKIHAETSAVLRMPSSKMCLVCKALLALSCSMVTPYLRSTALNISATYFLWCSLEPGSNHNLQSGRQHLKLRTTRQPPSWHDA